MASLRIKSNSSPRTTGSYQVWLLPSSEPQSASPHALTRSVPATVVSGLLLGHHNLLPAQQLALLVPLPSTAYCQLCMAGFYGPFRFSLRQTVSGASKGQVPELSSLGSNLAPPFIICVVLGQSPSVSFLICGKETILLSPGLLCALNELI